MKVGGIMKKYICEFLGTFALTFLACGVATIVGCNTPAGVLATALAFGLVIVTMAYSIGNISGCHINPAVSLAMFINKSLDKKDFAFYVLSQFLGAFAGSLLLGFVLGEFTNLGANSYNNVLPSGYAVTPFIALIVEVILTFFFVFTILNVTSKKENAQVSGIVIGLSLTLVHLIGIGITGTSVNPARSLAPAVLQGGVAFSQVWIFILAPLLGATLAALFYKYITKK